ncbi:hypothetical protein [Aliivibrio sifiae]|uniref:Thymidylate kinase-like domain-containing protein n=1 Tax=Aliivibrio sifiae TaxID=566293 RepID=A0A2S7X0H2_9GAMM|nr:hypothetical protein [Aliivibrio sifiae]PQJ83327.1 hypothetical protein BTO22_18235 [Aliivibrio sifiae]
MLKVYIDLFNELKRLNIFYLSWKSNHELNKALDGNTDLDLYVSYDSKSKFHKAIVNKKFKKMNTTVSNHPYIAHYLGYDEVEMKTVHLHVYYKIVTGQSNSKNYILPLDDFFKENCDNGREFPVLNSDAQGVIFLIRYFLKFGGAYNTFLLIRDREKYSKELEGVTFDYNGKLPLNINDLSYKKMISSFKSNNIICKYYTSIVLKLTFSGYKRRGFLSYIPFLYVNFFKRTVNKIFFKKKKYLDYGTVVSICGLDGSGKSTMVASLSELFSDKITVKKVSIGRPNPTKLTFVFWFFIRFIELIKNTKKDESKPIEKYFPKSNVGIISAFRYFLLSYERKNAIINAHRYAEKGYIVLTDRYITTDYGKMDSPRIVCSIRKSKLYNFLSKLEINNYKTMYPSDVVINLDVPVNVSIERNQKRNKIGKETDNEIRARHIINNNMNYISNIYFSVDATSEFEFVKFKVFSLVWDNV